VILHLLFIVVVVKHHQTNNLFIVLYNKGLLFFLMVKVICFNKYEQGKNTRLQNLLFLKLERSCTRFAL
jgi:hypothetical protein